jgi:hypothetical protein
MTLALNDLILPIRTVGAVPRPARRVITIMLADEY